MTFLRQLFQRLFPWRLRRAESPPAPVPEMMVPAHPPILREVTATGVRVYSLCGGCGARLGASATLCEACALRRICP